MTEYCILQKSMDITKNRKEKIDMFKKIKKIHKLGLVLGFFLGINFILAFAEEKEKEEGGLIPVICNYKPLPYRCIKIESSLTLDFLWNRPDSEWEITDEGISKGYTYYPDAGMEYGWDRTSGQTFNLDVGLHPLKRIVGGLGIEVTGDYADTLWLPINDEHRMHDEKENVKMVTGELKYLGGERFTARYFSGIGHYHWGYEGDMFNLFPETYIPNTYRRVSGESVPEGGEIKIKGKTNSFTVLSGPRLVWGGGASTLAKYNFKSGLFDSAFIYKNEKIDWAEKDKDKHKHTGELSTKTNIISGFPLQAGLIYQSFGTGDEYSYIEEVASGTGYAGSEYIMKKGETDFLDTLAIKMKVNTNKCAPLINEGAITYTHAGLLAGNKNEVTLQLDKKLSSLFYTTGIFTYRQPLVGPMPYLHEGTDENPGPVWSTPRGKDEPFWVNNDNREATICSLFLTYDPTPGSWFYKWQPNVLQEWNLNHEEDARFAFALGYTLSYLPTTTDLQTYVDESGESVWEPSATHGRWATKKPLSFMTLLSKVNLPKDYKFLISLRAGEELSDGIFSYTLNQKECKPITGLLSTTVSLAKNPYLAAFTYQQGVWGPEDWHRTYGQTFDRVYKASLSRNIGDFEVGIEYLGTRETDRKYITGMIGGFDEIKLFCIWRFGLFISPPPPLDTNPPRLLIEPLNSLFSPDGDGINDTVVFRLMVSDESEIKEWRVEILNKEGYLIKLFTSIKSPPFSIEWDGKSDSPEKEITAGEYSVLFKAEDSAENKATAPLVSVKIEIASKEIPKEIKITKEKEGLRVSIKASILFDLNRVILKKSAFRVLDKAAEILKSYPKNKLRVEGHADSIGSESYNQKLSELRAQSVADYFVSECGISSSRMNIVGWGETKPIASNATEEGRAKNRRVEIIILKLKIQE
jgi:outer membrane protein OmpA-like peptidoglycan-associated protein